MPSHENLRFEAPKSSVPLEGAPEIEAQRPTARSAGKPARGRCEGRLGRRATEPSGSLCGYSVRANSTGQTPTIAAVLEISLAPTEAAPATARSRVGAWLERECSDAGLADAARLVVSELVTNCVRHARMTEDAQLVLTASLGASTLRVELHDTGTDGTVPRRSLRAHEEGAGGFGLDLVAQLAIAWGFERDIDGTTVWLELPAAAGARA
jgi:anti-sigma regulatory factor (Ser/Thr protein kinase)